MRKIGMCLILMILFSLTECLAFGLRPYADIGGDMRIARSVYRVSNVPLAIRSTPNGFIERDTIKIPHELDWLSAMTGIEGKWSRLGIRTGLKTRFVMGNHIGREDKRSSQIAKEIYKTEIEYKCDECGNRAGSRRINYYDYYGVEMKEWLTFEPYLELRFAMQDKSYVYIGTSFRQFHLQSEGGWYKSGEMKFHPERHTTLARIKETSVFLGIENEDFDKKKILREGYYIGITFLDSPKMFSRAEGAEAEYDRTSFFVGLSFLADILK